MLSHRRCENVGVRASDEHHIVSSFSSSWSQPLTLPLMAGCPEWSVVVLTCTRMTTYSHMVIRTYRYYDDNDALHPVPCAPPGHAVPRATHSHYHTSTTRSSLSSHVSTGALVYVDIVTVVHLMPPMSSLFIYPRMVSGGNGGDGEECRVITTATAIYRAAVVAITTHTHGGDDTHTHKQNKQITHTHTTTWW